jgi:hypothetical protein
MRRRVLLLCLMATAYAGLALAQPAGSPNPPLKSDQVSQSLIGPGVERNVVSIEKVMGEIHQLMFQGPFTPQQATEVSKMMTRLGIMMHEMSSPQREKLAQKHEQELREMRRQIEIIKQQMQKNK